MSQDTLELCLRREMGLNSNCPPSLDSLPSSGLGDVLTKTFGEV